LLKLTAYIEEEKNVYHAAATSVSDIEKTRKIADFAPKG
jgi:hypothetical protein